MRDVKLLYLLADNSQVDKHHSNHCGAPEAHKRAEGVQRVHLIRKRTIIRHIEAKKEIPCEDERLDDQVGTVQTGIQQVVEREDVDDIDVLFSIAGLVQVKNC